RGALGPARPHAAPGARSARDQAAVRLDAAWRTRLRLGVEGARARARAPLHARSPRDGPVLRVRSRARAAHDLLRGDEARAGLRARDRAGRRAHDHALLALRLPAAAGERG